MTRNARTRRQRTKPATKPRTCRTRTSPYDVAQQLRTPREMVAYLEVWLNEHPTDTRGLNRALRTIARAAQVHLRARIPHTRLLARH